MKRRREGETEEAMVSWLENAGLFSGLLPVHQQDRLVQNRQDEPSLVGGSLDEQKHHQTGCSLALEHALTEQESAACFDAQCSKNRAG